MILERIKKTFELQRRSVHGPVALWGVLNGIFILYPISFLAFFAGGLEVLNNPSLYQGLIITGIVVWVLNLVFLLDLRRGILTSFGTYLMYLTGHIYAIIGFSAMSGDHSFLGLKIFLPLIFSIIMNIVMSLMVDLDSEEILSEKASKNFYNFLRDDNLKNKGIEVFLYDKLNSYFKEDENEIFRFCKEYYLLVDSFSLKKLLFRYLKENQQRISIKSFEAIKSILKI